MDQDEEGEEEAGESLQAQSNFQELLEELEYLVLVLGHLCHPD